MQENDSADYSNEDWKWFHVTFSCYGTWLPGDPRGFRTWKHREHVEGDYKSPPPPGEYDALHDQSKRRMKRPAVHLTSVQRRITGEAMLAMLVWQKATVVSIAIGAEHVHVVAKLPDMHARHVMGRAKKHAAHQLRMSGLAGGAWAKRCRTLPIRDREHQLNAIKYVHDHRFVGAWVWKWGEPMPKVVVEFKLPERKHK